MAYETKCFNCDSPVWQPLERAVQLAGLPPATCSAFMWMGEWKEGEQSYKHRATRNYARLHADSTESECLAQLNNAVSPERTWGKALDARLLR